MTLIDRDPAPYALTPGERSQFEQDGFLIVPDALDESTLADHRRLPRPERPGRTVGTKTTTA